MERDLQADLSVVEEGLLEKASRPGGGQGVTEQLGGNSMPGESKRVTLGTARRPAMVIRGAWGEV